jgi:diphthamide biosynthesis protein 7
MTPALFLAWTPENWLPSPPGKNAKAEEGFAVTFSDGRTSVFATNTKGTEITRGEDLVESQLESRESIETWFVALAGYQENLSYMFTGNDFGSLNTRRFAWTENDEDYTLEDYQTQNLDDKARHHTSGVTSILPLPVPLIFDAPVLLTGSYDEYIRVYHATGRGTVLAETRLGGGVWRLQLIRTEGKQMPAATGGSDTEAAGQSSFLVLASCMHAGARIVRIVWRRQGSTAVTGSDTAGEWNIEILAQFTEHQSMNYASDFWKGGDDRKTELVCVSSSFYDKRLCLWKVEF